MNDQTIRSASLDDTVDLALAEALAGIAGHEHVLTGFEQRLPYTRDRLPFAIFRERAGLLPGAMPRLVVRPADDGQVQSILKLCRQKRLRVIPYGLGSGVLGGAMPLGGEIILDLARLDGIVEINETDAYATVRAGMNGAAFEAELNAAGYTCGHLPQSIEISSVGGWAACRGGGQASSRFGKIEDIVVGLKAILPDGTPLAVRPVARRSVGPSIKDLIIGSEGAFGVITELSLRIWRKPEVERGMVLAFPTLQSAWSAARDVMQAELRPTVVRIYDRIESEERTKDIPLFRDKPFLAILAVGGPAKLAEAEAELALEIAARHGGEAGPSEPYEHWKKNRYVAFSQQWHDKGYFQDTIEVTGNWSVLPALYERIGDAVRSVHPELHFGAHWSHVYPEGACQYMTLRLPPMEEKEAFPLHSRLWDIVERTTLELGGSIAHHHGVGLFRNPWIRDELGAGLDVLQALKDALDPDNLLNPGKLGLRPAGDAVDIRNG